MEHELKIDFRRQRILELLAQDGQVKVTQLSELFHTTPVTIRSDLAALEKDGYLKRVTGGAVQTVRNFYTMDAQQRKNYNLEAKTAIAKAVAELIEDGDTLLINSGTTTLLIASELKKRNSLNVVTNSMSVSVELASCPTFRVLLLGGEVNAQYSFSYGNTALEQLSRYKADKAILSIDGIHSQAGITTYHAEESPICRMMMERSHETIVAADFSKFGFESFSNIADIQSADYYVTNKTADPGTVASIKELGKKVIFSDS
ncbi:MAG: DeoR/GlpR transcriptional regulator [Lachnospiraceae bacterium]|nr:DeoR/GlpR transcriptional regulator [Lachnospiraceae bacterium]MCI9305315.1 DeoR/GlpR transcriptional regulator [Lachnospiraceae bacterium]